MAKTNPYISQRTPALAFDDEQAENLVRPLARTRSRAGFRADEDGQDRDAERPLRSSGPGRRTGAPGDYAVEDQPSSTRRGRAGVQHGQWSSRRWTAFLFRTRMGRVVLGLTLLACVVLVVLAYRGARSFLERDARFRIDSSASIQIDGNTQITREELLTVFGGDIGRNIFFVPLARRQAELAQLPWVAHATVMRLLPDQLRVAVVERTPVAFVRLGSTVELVDADGIVLHLPPATLAVRHYSFPVVTGFTPAETPQARAARMHLYERFVAELDHIGPTNSAKSVQGGAEDDAAAQPPARPSVKISSQLSEVDLSDLEDVRAVVPAAGTDILLHFGDSAFLARYQSYQAHVEEWRLQYPHLGAVDLRYDRQVVLKMTDGAESEASSVDHGNSLTAAPVTAAPRAGALAGRPVHRAFTALHVVAHPSKAMRHTAGHGTAHGWRPQ